MAVVDRRAPVRTEYQSLYGIGLVLMAYVAGEAVGGSGFLAAFAAGIAVSLSNETLCACFLDLGQVVAEVLLLGAFVLFGAVLSAELSAAPLVPAVVLALLALFVVRPLSVGGALTLRRASLGPAARLLVGWFGPRGLASLLLALLAVQAGVPGARELFAVVGVVVIVSVVLHGSSATPFGAWYAARHGTRVDPEDRVATAADALRHGGGDAPRIDVADLVDRLRSGAPTTVVDVRSPGSRRAESQVIPGSEWVPPEDLAAWATDRSHDELIAAWCA